MARRTYSVNYFNLHGHEEEGEGEGEGSQPNNELDYIEFFRHLSQQPITNRVIRADKNNTIVLEQIFINETKIDMRLAAGDPDETLWIFDMARGETVRAETGRGRWAATVVRVSMLITPDFRIVGMESRRPGISASLFEKFLEKAAANNGRKIQFNLAPIAADSFSEEIEGFQRIREATIEIGEPNPGFSDVAGDLYELADRSNAKSIETTVKAKRNDSLRMDYGIVKDIKEISHEQKSSIKNAYVVGFRPGEREATKLSLRNYQEKSHVTTDTSLRPQEQDAGIWADIRQYIERIAARFI